MFNLFKKNKKAEEKVKILACVSGTCVPLQEVPDEVFASGVMGEGVGIIPTGNIVLAPVDATVTTVMEESLHAVGLQLTNGAELLIHIGVDTVNMKGKGFKGFVKAGDTVKVGDSLLGFTSEIIKEEGHPDTVIMTVTNATDYPDMKIVCDSGEVTAIETPIITF